MAEYTIDQLGWLAGRWLTEKWGGTMEEQWMAPAGKSMLGMSRIYTDSATTFIEYQLIEEHEEGIILRVTTKGGTSVDFALKSVEGRSAVFENPFRDAPRRIIYRLQQDGSLFARVEDSEGNGDDFVLQPG